MNKALDRQVGGGHYKILKIQPVEFIHANNLGFLEGCIIKRATRWRDKDGVQDLEKIIHEAQLLIDFHTADAEDLKKSFEGSGVRVMLDNQEDGSEWD